MSHKFTAACLLWMISMTTVMAQPGLRYCLCANEIYLGECRCPGAGPLTPDPPSCSCECQECESSLPSASEEETCSLLGGCSVDLFLALEEYALPSHSEPRERDHPSSDLLPHLPPTSADPSKIFRDSDHDVRGPPPPVPSVGSVPLFLRHSVFLL